MLTFVTLALGCEGESGSGMESCEDLTPTHSEDASLGFDSGDVLALVSTALPKSIVWDEITAGGTGADLELVITGVADDIHIVSPKPACAEEPPWDGKRLRVPLGATMTMAKGDVVAAGWLTVDAVGADSLDLVRLNIGWGMPATLSGQYEADLEEHIETGSFPDAVLDGVYVTGVGAWPEAKLDIEIQTHTDDAFSAQAVWRGHWQL